MNFNRNLLSDAVRYGLAAGAVGLLGLTAAPAIAQDDDAATLDRIEVTGSRIKRADVEGALPVTVIDRQQLEVSGDISVADFLRNTTFNSFGSFRPQSGSSAQSFAALSLRGLGSARTLILIDGRRAPIAPSAGQGQNLNSIPLAAVERIEILSDGASAIYGTDAIGGVVNIITRKDFNGVEMTIGAGNPKREGGETEEGSIIFGASGDRGTMLAGISYNNRGIIFQRDRPWSSGGVSTFGANLINARPAPGTLYGFSPGSFVAHPTNGSALPGFACNSNGFFRGGSGSTSRCFYDFTFVAADEAEVRNESTFARGQYQINDDWSTYLNATVSRLKTFGRYAPVPSSPFPGGQPFLPVGSPNHPAVRFPNAGYDATVPYFFRHRFAALGNRDTFTEEVAYDYQAGFQGRIGDVYLDVGARSSEVKYLDLGRNYVVGGLAQQFIASGRYNIYDPFGNPRSVLDSMIATINRDSGTKFEELFAIANMDLFEMGGGTAGLAVGVEYRKEEFFDIYDTLSSSGQIVGSAGNTAAGDRDVNALFGELLLPIMSNLEVSIAARRDDYSDYGSDTSPKVSVRFQPLDTVTLRGSYGQGFRAPTLDILTQQATFSADGVNDPQTCVSFGQPPGCQTQISAYVIANPNLNSEQSDQYSFGLVWDATDWLNMSVDYYNIEIENRISAISSALIISCTSGAQPCPAGVGTLPINVNPPVPSNGLGIARDPGTGAILYIQRGFANRGTLETSGLDFNIRTTFDLADWGQLANQLQLGYVDDYSFDGGRNLVNDPGYPEFRATLATQWTFGDFNFAWNLNHVDSTISNAGLNVRGGGSDYGYSRTLPSWTTHDLQATWSAPWNGKVTVGVNNIADKDPVLDPLDPGGRGFNFNLYDGYGRVPYVRYTQNF
ncbi:TonB-dependent receptor plug domain-containing protein [Pseudomarimonas salicorniae]|uniref:TonB-dependent receptor n=1 Tax=Pseudomarimonas salicorniae TaxID=2933270 RepID=A0ABT0GC71_9GAMM|nr:TonB-dependent receptor [Lysobacter sp. CAU 1642]MCK7592134.1 TonB-dependent receptor [Lysobacter sp. CAU 1642]